VREERAPLGCDGASVCSSSAHINRSSGLTVWSAAGVRAARRVVGRGRHRP
jgi:hypothetical protein